MNTLVADSLQLTTRSAPKPAPVAIPAHFLFIMPTPASQEDHALMFTIADSMASVGYVYIASVDQTTVEDRGQVRYLPYHPGQFPSFGQVRAVFVLRDRAVALAALAEYSDAAGYLLEPCRELAAITSATQRMSSPTTQHHGALVVLPENLTAAA